MSANENPSREAIDRAMQSSGPIQIRYRNQNGEVSESIIYPKRWRDESRFGFEASYAPEGRIYPLSMVGVLDVRTVDHSPEPSVGTSIRRPTLSEIEQSRPVVTPKKPTPASQKPKQAVRNFDRVQTSQDWQQLLHYYQQILIHEEQQSFLIPQDRAHYPISDLNRDVIATFLRGEAQLHFPIRGDDGWILPVAKLMMDKRDSDSLCIGYPILCIEGSDQRRFFAPLMLSAITCTEDENNSLTLTADDLDISYAVLRHFGLDYADYEQLLGQIHAFDQETQMEQTVELLLSVIEDAWGTSIERTSKATNFQHRTGQLYEVPLLFRASRDIKLNLIQELTELSSVNIADISPALRALLDHANSEAYRPACLPDKQPSTIIERINRWQQTGVQASRQHDLTVVTGPPGTGKSQMILNIVADAVMRGEKVLIASHTNAAVDVVVKRLQDNSAIHFDGIVRVGNRENRREAGSSIQKTTEWIDGSYVVPVEMQLKDNRQQYELAWSLLYDLENALPKLAHGQKSAQELANRLLNNRATLEQEHRALLDTASVPLRASIRDQKPAIRDLGTWAAYRVHGPITGKIRLLLKALLHLKTPTRFLSDRINIIAAKLDSPPWLPDNPDPRAILQTTRSLTNLVLCAEQRDQLEEDARELGQVAQGLHERSARLDFLQLPPDLLAHLNDWVATTLTITNPDTKTDMLPALVGKLHTGKDFVPDLLDVLQELRTLGVCILRQHWLQQVQQAPQEVRDRASDYGEALAMISQSERREDYNVLKDRVERYFSDALEVFPVWATTNLSARANFPLTSKLFDLVIIDEASQCDIASAIPLLYRAKRAVIIGDAKQLQHVTPVSDEADSAKAAEYGVDNPLQYKKSSVFKLASSRTSHLGQIMLKDHYRSHREIISFSNKVFYGRQLTLRTDLLGQGVPKEFLERAGGVCWVEVNGLTEDVPGKSVLNRAEIDNIKLLIPRLIALLQQYDWPNATLGIVTPFRPQRQEFERLFGDNGMLDPRLIGTAHTFQGSECSILIFSPVVSDGIPDGTLQWLNDSPHLLNVAVTRARCTLLIVGNLAYCRQLPPGSPYRELTDYVSGLPGAVVSSVDALLAVWHPPHLQ